MPVLPGPDHCHQRPFEAPTHLRVMDMMLGIVRACHVVEPPSPSVLERLAQGISQIDAANR